MPTFHVTVPEFLQVLEAAPKGAKIVTMRTATQPKMLVKSRKTGTPNPYADGVSRLVYRSGIIGPNYEAAVNRQQAKEGVAVPDAPFVAEALWKGKGMKTGPYTVTHTENGGVYFPFKPAQHADNENLCGTAVDLIEARWVNNTNGLALNADEIAGLEHYLPPIGKSQSQGVESDVVWRVYKAESIVAVHGICKGGVYYLIHPKT